jgi:hypothetical protein
MMRPLIKFFRKSSLYQLLFAALILISGYARFSTIGERMTNCDDNGFLLNVLGVDSPTKAADSVSRAWTYAPGQYLLGFPLWSKATTFESGLKGARLPSALSATAGMILFFLVIFLIQRGVGWPEKGGVFTAMLAALSMRALVESQQGYSYANTYLFAALQVLAMVWLVQRDRWGWTRWLYALGASSAVGMVGVSFNYQMLFPTAAAGVACLIGAWRELRTPGAASRSWARPALAAVSGIVGFSAAYLWLWNAYLAALVRGGTNIPPWAQFEIIKWSAAEGVSGYLTALVRKVLLLFSFLTAPVWPALVGSTTQLIWGAGILLLAAWGTWIGWRNREPASQLVALYGAAATILALAANLAGQVPVGVTRHSFVLFVPVLGMLLIGELHLSHNLAWRKRFLFAAVLGVVLFQARFDEFSRQTGNQFDVARLTKEVNSRRPVALVALDCTWDVRVAQQISKNTAFPCGVVEDAGPVLKSLEARPDGGTVLLTSHRSDPLKAVTAIVQKHPDWKAESLIAIQPQGSTEPIGIVNGGNGFFLAAITKPVSIQKGCAAQFGPGWGVREGAADWWRWTDRGGTVTIISSEPESIKLTGLVVSTTDDNVLLRRVDGKAAPNIRLNRGAELNLTIPVEGTPKELEFLSANAGIKLPPDTRTFAMQIRNWKFVGEKSGPCEIR